MTNIIDFLRDHLKTLSYICCLLLVAIALWAALLDIHHAHSWVEEHIPAFWSFFGFICAVVIIVASKLFGKAGIQVDSQFYCKRDESSENGEEK